MLRCFLFWGRGPPVSTAPFARLGIYCEAKSAHLRFTPPLISILIEFLLLLPPRNLLFSRLIFSTMRLGRTARRTNALAGCLACGECAFWSFFPLRRGYVPLFVPNSVYYTASGDFAMLYSALLRETWLCLSVSSAYSCLAGSVAPFYSVSRRRCFHYRSIPFSLFRAGPPPALLWPVAISYASTTIGSSLYVLNAHNHVSFWFPFVSLYPDSHTERVVGLSLL